MPENLVDSFFFFLFCFLFCFWLSQLLSSVFAVVGVYIVCACVSHDFVLKPKSSVSLFLVTVSFSLSVLCVCLSSGVLCKRIMKLHV